VATGRATFVREAGRSVHRRALALLADLGAQVRGPQDLVEVPERVPRDFMTGEGDGEVGILLCATFADASVAEAAFGDARGPVILWAVPDPAPLGERLNLNSLCGANLAAHALVRRGVPVRLVYGDPEERAVRDALGRALRGELGAVAPAPNGHRPVADGREVAPALEGLRGRAIGVVGDAPPGFTTCEYDRAWLRERLGLEVRRLDLRAAFARILGASDGASRSEVAAAAAEAPSLLRLPAPAVLRMGSTVAALGSWADEVHVQAVAVRCWPEFPMSLGLCPCSALGRLAARGLATACEADVNGAATMLLLRALGAADVYLADLVRVDEPANMVTFWHCGLAPVDLAAERREAKHDLHCNRGIGVAGNFALRPGRVTVARVSWSGDRYRLVLAGGEGVPAPNRFKGNSLDVRLDGDAGRAVRALIEAGIEHHTVLAWGELRPWLRRAAALLELDTIEL
jgi:L-fucose isomerase-like protein